MHRIMHLKIGMKSIFHKRLTRFIIYDLYESRKVHSVVNLLLPFETFLFCHYASREASFSLRGCVLRYVGVRGVEWNELITARARPLFRFLRKWLPPEVYVWLPTSVNAFICRFSMTNYGDEIAAEAKFHDVISFRNFYHQVPLFHFSKIYFLCLSSFSITSLLYIINIK